MRTPIFRSASYLLVVGVNEPALQITILEQCREHRLRTYFCQGIQELKVISEMMSRITALLVFAENIPTVLISESIDSFLKKQIPVRIFGPAPELQSLSHASCKISTYAKISSTIDELVSMMVPPGLEKVLLEDAATILPRFLEKTLSQKCFIIWKQTYFALLNISDSYLIGYPSAMVHGFFWSEIIHHYARSKVQKK